MKMYYDYIKENTVTETEAIKSILDRDVTKSRTAKDITSNELEEEIAKIREGNLATLVKRFDSVFTSSGKVGLYQVSPVPSPQDSRLLYFIDTKSLTSFLKSFNHMKIYQDDYGELKLDVVHSSYAVTHNIIGITLEGWDLMLQHSRAMVSNTDLDTYIAGQIELENTIVNTPMYSYSIELD